MNRSAVKHIPWETLGEVLALDGLATWSVTVDRAGSRLTQFSDGFLALWEGPAPRPPLPLERFIDEYIDDSEAEMVKQAIERSLTAGGEALVLQHRLKVGPDRWLTLRTVGRALESGRRNGPVELALFSRVVPGPAPEISPLPKNDLSSEEIKVGLWDWDVITNQVRLNSASANLVGLELEDMKGFIDQWYELMHPEDLALASDVTHRAIFGSDSSYGMGYRLRRRDGHYVWVYEIGRVMARDEAGLATRLAGIHFDFSFLKNDQAQEASYLTMAEQKTALESKMEEKTRLLEDVRRRVEELMEKTGRLEKPVAGEDGRISFPAEVTEEGSGVFARRLRQAFSLVTDQMVWYKAILDSLPFPVAVYDVHGRWSYLNTSSAEVHGGLAVKDYLGRPTSETVADYLDSEVSADPGGAEITRFTRFRPATGRLYHGQNSVLKDEKGQDIGRIETLQDVTEIREADERTRIMSDAMPLACTFWDENLRVVDCNQAAVTLFDLADKQAYIDNFFSFSPQFQPNGRLSDDLSREHLTKAFRDGSHRFEWLHQKSDGTPLPSEINLVRVARRDSFIVAGYTRDLRELKRTRAERDIERQLLRKIMDSTPICFTITVGGAIKFINPFARNFTHHQVGDHISDIYADQDTWRELTQELASRNYVNWRPVEILRADGQVRAMLLNAFKTDYYGEAGIMSWYMDVTELKEARDAAEESTRAKSEFLANMSHEIRTPMNAILGLIHLVMQTEMTPLQREYLQKTESSAKTLLRIINDILDFSKIEAGKLEVEREEFFLVDVLQSVTDQISGRAYEKGLEFLLRVPPSTPAGLIGDQIRLAQVLINLAGNAVKFTEKGQVTLKVDTLEESDTEVTLRFSVEDTGIGLTPEQIRHLFSAFSQAEVSTARRYGGTGLGLVISKSLVELMNGQIWCESTPGGGSTFSFTAVFGRHSADKRYVTKRKDFGGLSALAVDDNLVALEILNDFLKALGFTVVTASSGQEALSIMADWSSRGRHFDLVFIDWKMPDMDGVETSDRIHQLIAPTKLPVIIMATAYNRDDVLGLARKSGIHNVMTKPLSPSTLLNVLVDIFGRGLPEKESKLQKAHEMTLVKELAGSRILLAEDNEVNQLVASRILKNAGLVVEIADNGLKAVEMVKKGNFDLVLMDIQMPEMDGIEATREIRNLPEFADLPIVAMTAHAMSGDRELSLAAGMNDHVNKPINLQELFTSLAKWLRRKPGYK